MKIKRPLPVDVRRSKTSLPRRGGVRPYKRLIGICRWMGSHFTTGVTIMGSHFQPEIYWNLEWGRKFSDFGGK